jgi:hypothetical protein
MTRKVKVVLTDMDRDEKIITNIITAFKSYALGDIKFVSSSGKVIAGFILASCFIEQLSAYRYARKPCHETFKEFVEDYLPGYKELDLYSDLRNRLVHNYSIGTKYYITNSMSHLSNLEDKKFLNLSDFTKDLEIAFNKYQDELRGNSVIRDNAFLWYKKGYRIIVHIKGGKK